MTLDPGAASRPAGHPSREEQPYQDDDVCARARSFANECALCRREALVWSRVVWIPVAPAVAVKLPSACRGLTLVWTRIVWIPIASPLPVILVTTGGKRRFFKLERDVFRQQDSRTNFAHNVALAQPERPYTAPQRGLYSKVAR